MVVVHTVPVALGTNQYTNPAVGMSFSDQLKDHFTTVSSRVRGYSHSTCELFSTMGMGMFYRLV